MLCRIIQDPLHRFAVRLFCTDGIVAAHFPVFWFCLNLSSGYLPSL